MVNSKDGSKEGMGGLYMHLARQGCQGSAGVQLGSASLCSPLLLRFSPCLQLFEKE